MKSASQLRALRERDLPTGPAPAPPVLTLAIRPRPSTATYAGKWVQLPNPPARPRSRFRRFVRFVAIVFGAIIAFLIVF